MIKSISGQVHSTKWMELGPQSGQIQQYIKLKVQVQKRMGSSERMIINCLWSGRI